MIRSLPFVVATLVLGLTAILSPRPATAWGKFGHLTVCDLAYRNLTPASRAALNDLLQSKKGGITVKGRGKMPDQHYTSFNMACLEEDEVPRRHKDDHFINVARSVKVIPSACPGTGECILTGIDRDLAILRDTSRPREERVFALMALGHWVGDIHQPLHISFADDQGGNGIDINLIGRCGTSKEGGVENLHAVWDKCLLDAGLFERVRMRADFKPNWSRFTITYRAVDSIMANTGVAAERAMVTSDPTTWANESYAVTLAADTLYCIRVGANCQYSEQAMMKTNSKRMVIIDQAYLVAHMTIAQDRITKAGFRLAHLLNQALDPAYQQPMQDGAQPI